MNAREALDDFLRNVCPPGTLQIKHVRGLSMTEYFISGTLDEVTDAIKQTFNAYHPLGYGTMVHHIMCESDSLYRARMSRANSAD